MLKHLKLKLIIRQLTDGNIFRRNISEKQFFQPKYLPSFSWKIVISSPSAQLVVPINNLDSLDFSARVKVSGLRSF